MPSEPTDSNFKQKIRAKCYPALERGGLIWTYMGPRSLMPAAPEIDWAVIPDDHRYLSRRLQECNYLQALEGGIDSSHVSSLHRHTMTVDPLFKGAKGNEYNLSDLRPHFEVVESPGGLYIGARRNAGDRQYYLRITQLIMPSFTLIPP